jgi:hypothetical protein
MSAVEAAAMKYPPGFFPYGGTFLPDELLPCLGYVTACAAELDRDLNFTIWKLAGVDFNIGRAITAPLMSPKTRLSIFSNLAKICAPDEDTKERLLTISECIGIEFGLRNLVTHNPPFVRNKRSRAIGKTMAGWAGLPDKANKVAHCLPA